MNQRTVAPEEADLMIGRSWFSEQRTPVLVIDEAAAFESFDAAARAQANGAERVLFVHGLKVSGAVTLAGAKDCTYVVLGDLHVGRLELGDATLAVSGRIVADQFVWAPGGVGMLALGGDATSEDATAPVLPPVLAPIVVWFDPRRSTDVIYAAHDKTLRRLAPDELPAPLAAVYDARAERWTDPQRALDLLRSGSWR